MKYNITIQQNNEYKKIEVEHNTLIADILDDFHMDYPCAKRGVCKKCLVHVTGNISKPSQEEEDLGSLLDDGFRLACKTRILGECCITLNENHRLLQSADDKFKREITSSNPIFKKYGLAVDIGTTTISASIIKGEKILVSESIKNPQIAYGADVISRIQEQMRGKTEEISASVVSGINTLIHSMTEKLAINIDEIDASVITGNTVMLYLLTKRDTTPLSKAPFTANYLGNEWLLTDFYGIKLSKLCKVYLTPCMSAFVGGDITTAILASEMTKDTTSLLVDIGTNGEIVLFKDNKLYSSSTAAGPAFEGVGIKHGMYGTVGAIEKVYIEDNQLKTKTIGDSKALGICGSGIVDAVACMLELEAVEDTGYMEEDEFVLTGDITVTDKDIRAIQLAKSAICAGIITLVKENNIGYNDISTLYIAGGFGSYLDFENAGKIGLIPYCLTKKVKQIGNAALTGAEMILQNKDYISIASKYAWESDVINLANSKVFMEEYTNNMLFE